MYVSFLRNDLPFYGGIVKKFMRDKAKRLMDYRQATG